MFIAVEGVVSRCKRVRWKNTSSASSDFSKQGIRGEEV